MNHFKISAIFNLKDKLSQPLSRIQAMVDRTKARFQALNNVRFDRLKSNLTNIKQHFRMLGSGVSQFS